MKKLQFLSPEALLKLDLLHKNPAIKTDFKDLVVANPSAEDDTQNAAAPSN